MTATNTTNDDLAEAIFDMGNIIGEQLTGIKVDISDLKQDVSGLKQGVSNLWVEQRRTNERLDGVENEIRGIHSDILEIYDRI